MLKHNPEVVSDFEKKFGIKVNPPDSLNELEIEDYLKAELREQTRRDVSFYAPYINFATENNIKLSSSNRNDCLSAMEYLEGKLGGVNRSDIQSFNYLPPTDVESDEWLAIGKKLPMNFELYTSMLALGILPVPCKYLAPYLAVDYFDALNYREEYCLLDGDYGVMLLPTPNRCHNINLYKKDEWSYAHYYKDLQIDLYPQRVLDIGSYRGNRFWRGSYPTHPSKLNLIELRIKNRRQLDKIIGRLNKAIDGTKYQLWFRGQNQDYNLPEIDKSLKSILPYRDATDKSQVPSLYRYNNKNFKDFMEYLKTLTDLQKYNSFYKHYLNLPEILTLPVFSETIRQLKNFSNEATEPLVIEAVGTNKKTGETVTHFHYYNPFLSKFQSSLFLQHYGFPTPVLDITKGIDEALFFAQYKIRTDGIIKFNGRQKPIIYIYILNSETDPFIDSGTLMAERGVERPKRQKCGLLYGANNFCKNYYSRFISIKLVLESEITIDDPYYYFPDESEDDFLSGLKQFYTYLSNPVLQAFCVNRPDV